MIKTRLTHIIARILIGSLALLGCSSFRLSIETPTPEQAQPTAEGSVEVEVLPTIRNKTIGIAAEIGPVCEEAKTWPNQMIIGPLGKIWMPSGTPLPPKYRWFDEAETAEEINTIICIESDLKRVASCNYYGVGAVKRYQPIWEVTVVDWNTRQIRAMRTFVSAGSRCPTSITLDEIGGIYGPDPIRPFRDWLISIDTATFIPDLEITGIVENDGTLSIRSGPSSRFELLKTLPADTRVTAVARTETGDWILVRTPDGSEGWVLAKSKFVQWESDINMLPSIQL